MPMIYSTSTNGDTVCSVWRCSESDDFFEQKLHIHPLEMHEFTMLHGRRRSEWLAARYLLGRIIPGRESLPCIKDTHGKPHLEGSDYHISLSHTTGFVAAIKSKKPCGTDIQMITPKIEKIAPRFISADEYAYIPTQGAMDYYHTLWSAKEAMYKAYGKKELDFRDHIFVEAFKFDSFGFSFSGSVQKNNFLANFALYCRQIENTILVYAIEQNQTDLANDSGRHPV